MSDEDRTSGADIGTRRRIGPFEMVHGHMRTEPATTGSARGPETGIRRIDTPIPKRCNGRCEQFPGVSVGTPRRVKERTTVPFAPDLARQDVPIGSMTTDAPGVVAGVSQGVAGW